VTFRPLVLSLALLATAAPAGLAAEPGNVKGKPRSYLYVQNARHGSFTAIKGKARHFRLRLRDVDPAVLFFTDRPARDTGLISQKGFLGSLFRPGRSTPNAAVEIVAGRKDQDVLAVKLSDPRASEKARTLSYDATVLRTVSTGLRHYRGRLDRNLPASFGAVSLFVDSGSSFGNTCQANVINNTGSFMGNTSATQWSTDSWADKGDPSGTGIPSDGQDHGAGWDLGGTFRGCSFTTTWSLNDGSSITITTSDPESGSNDFTCGSSNPSKYQCTLRSDSTIHGPDLIANWEINQV
jgi:hypothetical protein